MLKTKVTNLAYINPHDGDHVEHFLEMSDNLLCIGQFTDKFYSSYDHLNVFPISASPLYLIEYLLPNINVAYINETENVRPLIKSVVNKLTIGGQIILPFGAELEELANAKFLDLDIKEEGDHLVLS